MQKSHTLLFSCSQSVLAAGIQQNQPGTEQNASDNITQPVHAGNQPPHNHKGGECRQQGKKNVQNSRPADAAVQLFIIAIFKNKANSRRNGTSLSSQKAKLSEKHIVSRSEEHPGSVP